MLGIFAGQQFESEHLQNVYVLSHAGVKGQEINRRAFVALEAETSNILILGATGPDEDTGGAVTYMHLHLHPHVQYSTETRHTSLLFAH